MKALACITYGHRLGRLVFLLISLTTLGFIIAENLCVNNNHGRGNASLISRPGESLLYIENCGLHLKGWDKGGCTYFFAPSYADFDNIDQSDSEYKVYLKNGGILNRVSLGDIQDVQVFAPDGTITPWKICFMKSANLYSLDIFLNGAEITDIDHDDYFPAEVEVRTSRGDVVYESGDVLIKGRGNSTWEHEKKPYQIKFAEDVSLCGMRSTDKWTLLAGFNEPTKIQNKLVFDMAAAIGMEYAIESDWVDVYANGRYMGNYLLCHEPGIGKTDLDTQNLEVRNREYFSGVLDENNNIRGYQYDPHIDDISVGYIIEKKADRNCRFRTEDDYFSLREPANASIDEVKYIADFVCSIYNDIKYSQDRQTKSLDIYSFARRYLLDEIALNPDAAIGSCSFYKKSGYEKLYAGPNWDYDIAFGLTEDFENYSKDIVDFIKEIYEENDLTEEERLVEPHIWDILLLKNKDYHDYVGRTLEKNLHVFESFYQKRIDEYYNRVNASLKMDWVLWEQGKKFNYRTIDNNYRYIKYFIYERLRYLMDEYGIKDKIIAPRLNEESVHKVTFIFPDGENDELVVPDGALLTEYDVPEFDGGVYENWADCRSDKALSFYLPVYEDVSFYLYSEEE